MNMKSIITACCVVTGLTGALLLAAPVQAKPAKAEVQKVCVYDTLINEASALPNGSDSGADGKLTRKLQELRHQYKDANLQISEPRRALSTESDLEELCVDIQVTK